MNTTDYGYYIKLLEKGLNTLERSRRHAEYVNLHRKKSSYVNLLDVCPISIDEQIKSEILECIYQIKVLTLRSMHSEDKYVPMEKMKDINEKLLDILIK